MGPNSLMVVYVAPLGMGFKIRESGPGIPGFTVPRK